MEKDARRMNVIIGENKKMSLLPVCIDENNPVMVIDAYVDILNLEELGFGKYAPMILEVPCIPQMTCSNFLSTTI